MNEHDTRPDFLDTIAVASPCPADWDEMTGDDRVRHCELCALNVYNLSGMSREEAEQVVREREGRLCVRFVRRADGTVLTRDCPVGLAAIRRRARWVIARCAALLGFLLLAPFGCKKPNKVEPQPVSGSKQVELLGEVCPPTVIQGKPMIGRVAPEK